MRVTITTSKYTYTEQELEPMTRLGFSARPFGKKHFVLDDLELEMSSLEELLEFSKEWGALVISADGDGLDVEIYNDYREC